MKYQFWVSYSLKSIGGRLTADKTKLRVFFFNSDAEFKAPAGERGHKENGKTAKTAARAEVSRGRNEGWTKECGGVWFSAPCGHSL